MLNDDYLMDDGTRTLRSILTAKAAVITVIAEQILQFYSRGVFIDILGVEVLGLNTTAHNLLSYLNLTESGIGAAMIMILYAPIYKKDYAAVNELVSLLGSFYKRIAAIVLAGSALLMCFFPMIFSKMSLPLWYAYGSFGVVLVGSLLSRLFAYRQILFNVSQQAFLIRYRTTTIAIVKVVCQIMAVKYSTSGYVWWLALELVGTSATVVMIRKMTAKHFPYVKSSTLGFGVLKWKYPLLLTKARQLFVHSITGIVLTQTMPLIIYGIISMEKVGVYGNYLSIINGISQLGQIPFTSMKAGVGSLIVEGDKNKQIGVFKEIFAFNFWLAAIICFGLVFLTQPFVTLWVGHEYLLPDLTLWLMILSFYLSFTRLPFDIYFQAMGMCQDVGAPVVEAVLNIGAAIVLGMKFGLDGIIAGSMTGTLLIVMVWKPYFLFRTGFRVHVRVFLRMYAKLIGLMAAVGMVCTFAMRYVTLKPDTNWFHWVLFSGMTVVPFAVLLFMALYKSEGSVRHLIVRFWNRKHFIE